MIVYFVNFIIFSMLVGGVYLIVVQEIRLENMRKRNLEEYKIAINTPKEALIIAIAVFLLCLFIYFI